MDTNIVYLYMQGQRRVALPRQQAGPSLLPGHVLRQPVLALTQKQRPSPLYKHFLGPLHLHLLLALPKMITL